MIKLLSELCVCIILMLMPSDFCILLYLMDFYFLYQETYKRNEEKCQEHEERCKQYEAQLTAQMRNYQIEFQIYARELEKLQRGMEVSIPT